MSCEICGEWDCCRSFHSFEEQEKFENNMNENYLEEFKFTKRNIINARLERLDCEVINGEVYIRLDQAIEIVDDVLW